jgi:hypothetical protein
MHHNAWRDDLRGTRRWTRKLALLRDSFAPALHGSVSRPQFNDGDSLVFSCHSAGFRRLEGTTTRGPLGGGVPPTEGDRRKAVHRSGKSLDNDERASVCTQCQASFLSNSRARSLFAINTDIDKSNQRETAIWTWTDRSHLLSREGLSHYGSLSIRTHACNNHSFSLVGVSDPFDASLELTMPSNRCCWKIITRLIIRRRY